MLTFQLAVQFSVCEKQQYHNIIIYLYKKKKGLTVKLTSDAADVFHHCCRFDAVRR